MFPDTPVVLGAQFKMRISEGVDGPITVTAMAISGDEDNSKSVVFVSCDLPEFRNKWYDDNNFLNFIGGKSGGLLKSGELHGVISFQCVARCRTAAPFR